MGHSFARLARGVRLLAVAAVSTGAVLVTTGTASAAIGTWTKLAAPFPEQRDQASMAYHAARGELVLFGGNNEDAPHQRNDTWTWNGARWTLERPSASPSSRVLAAMAGDPARGNVVLFGGFDRFSERDGIFNDTWTWDGTTWRRHRPMRSPRPRYGAAMTYDAARGKVVLFGGYTVGGEVQDTWTWDGRTWKEEIPATVPPARLYGTMAYHPATRKVVLYGGYNFLSGGNLGDTWTWDGLTWRQAKLPQPGPAPRSHAGMATDRNGNVVVFGGSSTLLADSDDTWTWDGVRWTARSPASSPSARSSMSMAYDPARRNIVLFGGRSCPAACTYFDDTWTWDGTTWRRPPIPDVPSRRSEQGFAYDSRRGEVVLFGGWNHTEDVGETWTWRSGLWTRKNPAASPSDRSLVAMSYDAARGETVLFGGGAHAARLGDTWTWDGVNWRARTPSASPSARYGATMQYDPVRRETVLFGGSALGAVSNETWTWNGATWTQKRPPTSPPPRYRASIAFDAARGTIVLFGGMDASFNLSNETWVWNGTTWRRALPATSPSRRYSASMAYDPVTRRVVLFGGAGEATGPEGDLADTWTWDGTTWTRHSLVSAPSRRHSAGLAAAGPDRLLLFGGSSLTEGALRDTWIWRGNP